MDTDAYLCHMYSKAPESHLLKVLA